MGTGQSAYEEPPKHLPLDSGAQAVGGSGFLLTSARAVMLELVTVHSFFAVSTFPVDARERSSLSQGIPTPLCSPASTQAPCSDGGSSGFSPAWELQPSLKRNSCRGQHSSLTTSVGSGVCFQVKVFQRSGRARALQNLERGPGGCLLALWLRYGTSWEGPAESGLTTQGSSSSSIKNSQELPDPPSCRTRSCRAPLSLLSFLLPTCTLWPGPSSVARGWVEAQGGMFQRVK